VTIIYMVTTTYRAIIMYMTGLTECILHTFCRVQWPYCKSMFKSNNVHVFPVRDGILV